MSVAGMSVAGMSVTGATGALQRTACAAETELPAPNLPPASGTASDSRRASAAFERGSRDKPVFAVAYVVRAVSPGSYVLPQAYVEDMYRPDRFGRTATGKIDIAGK